MSMSYDVFSRFAEVSVIQVSEQKFEEGRNGRDGGECLIK